MVLFHLASTGIGFLIGILTHKTLSLVASRRGVGKRKKAKVKARPTTFLVPREELKMVLLVNEALKMGKGKIGAQCAHAALGVTQQFQSSAKHELAFRQWEHGGQAKIALKIEDDEEMDLLASKAASLGLPTYIVHDAGRTQIPAGSQTVLAIGPGPKSSIDIVTGHLRLL